MKTSHILILAFVIILIVLLINWNYISGSKKKFKYGGDVRFVDANFVMNEVWYCCKEVRPDGGCHSWQPQDYPCE